MRFPATVIAGSVCRYRYPLLPTPDNASALLARARIMSLHLQTTGPVYVGASAYLGDTLTVYPYFPETISVGGAEYVGSAIHLIDTVEISPSGN
jgi:Bacteriophage P2-related tail formation protein